MPERKKPIRGFRELPVLLKMLGEIKGVDVEKLKNAGDAYTHAPLTEGEEEAMMDILGDMEYLGHKGSMRREDMQNGEEVPAALTYGGDSEGRNSFNFRSPKIYREDIEEAYSEQNPFKDVKMSVVGMPETEEEWVDAMRPYSDGIPDSVKRRAAKARAIVRPWYPKGTIDDTEERSEGIYNGHISSPYTLSRIALNDRRKEIAREYGEYVGAKNKWRNAPAMQDKTDEEYNEAVKRYENVKRPYGEVSRRALNAGAEVGYDEYGNPYIDWDNTARNHDVIKILKSVLPKGNVHINTLREQYPHLSEEELAEKAAESYSLDTGNLTEQEYRQLAPKFKELNDAGIIAVNVPEMLNSKNFSNKEFYGRSDGTVLNRLGTLGRGVASFIDGISELGRKALSELVLNRTGNKGLAKAIGGTPDWLEKKRLLDVDRIRERYGDQVADAWGNLLTNYEGEQTPVALEKQLGSLIGDKEVENYLKQASDRNTLTGALDRLTSEYLGKTFEPTHDDKTGKLMESLGPLAGGAVKSVVKKGLKGILPTAGFVAGSEIQNRINNQVTPEQESNTEFHDESVGDLVKELAAGFLGGGVGSAGLKRLAESSGKLLNGLSPEEYNKYYTAFQKLYTDKGAAEKAFAKVQDVSPETLRVINEMFPRKAIESGVSAERALVDRFLDKNAALEDLDLKALEKRGLEESRLAEAYSRYVNNADADISRILNKDAEELSAGYRGKISAEASPDIENWLIKNDLRSNDSLQKKLEKFRETADRYSGGMTPEGIMEAVGNQIKNEKDARQKVYNAVMGGASNERFKTNMFEAAKDVLKTNMDITDPGSSITLKKLVKLDPGRFPEDLEALIKNRPEIVEGKSFKKDIDSLREPEKTVGQLLDLRRTLLQEGERQKRGGNYKASALLTQVAKVLDTDLEEAAANGNDAAKKALEATAAYHEMSKPIDEISDVYNKVMGVDIKKQPTPEEIISNLGKLDATQRQRLLERLPVEGRWAVRNLWTQKAPKQAMDAWEKLSDNDFSTLFGEQGEEFKELARNANLRNNFDRMFDGKPGYSLSSLNRMLETGLLKKAPSELVESIYGAMEPGLSEAQKRSRRNLIDYVNEREPYIKNNKLWIALKTGNFKEVTDKLQTPEDVVQLKYIFKSMKDPKLREDSSMIFEKKIDQIGRDIFQNAEITEGPFKGGMDITKLNKELGDKLPMLKALAPTEAFYQNVSDYQKVLNKMVPKVDKFMETVKGAGGKKEWNLANFMTIKNLMSAIVQPSAGVILGGVDRLRYGHKYKKLCTDPAYAANTMENIGKSFLGITDALKEAVSSIKKHPDRAVKTVLQVPGNTPIGKAAEYGRRAGSVYLNNDMR